MAGVDDLIDQWVKQAERTGELEKSPFHGKRLQFDDGFEGTLEEHRMSHKVLKNAGYVPYEVELMQALAAKKEELEAASEEDVPRLRKEVAELRQKIAIRLERMGR